MAARDGGGAAAGEVHVIMTEVNGYRNVFGHVLYSDKTEADRVAADALRKGLYDHVWVTSWKVV